MCTGVPRWARIADPLETLRPSNDHKRVKDEMDEQLVN